MLNNISDFIHATFIYLPFCETTILNNHAEVQSKNVFLFIFIIIALPVLVALFLLARFIYRNTVGKQLRTTVAEDYLREAEQHEKSGNFVSAANIYENRLKKYRKAAELYEKGRDYKRAAELYDHLGMSQKSKEMFQRAGLIEDAAEISLVEGEFEEAATLYKQAGKGVDAAKALEIAGQKQEAVRAYREAGEYKKASQLLEEQGLLKEAAEMFSFCLRGEQLNDANVDDFYQYSLKLERAGGSGEALDVLHAIDRFNPTYKDVREKIQRLTVTGDAATDLSGKTSLRGFIRSGTADPRDSLKLWLNILRQLQDAYRRGRAYGLLSPDNILIDSQNNISFLRKPLTAAYTPPESTKGLSLDERADIYSAGVMLYEMLAGNLDGLGSSSILEIVDEVPEWLDDIVIKCIKKVREDRYQSIEDIFTEIKKLSKSKKEAEQKD